MSAPKGNRNAAKGREYANALWFELKNYADKGVKKGNALKLVARAQIGKALDGDSMAARDIADRLDGKPAQSIIADVDGELRIVHKLG